MADLKTYLGISDTDIKSVSGLSADYTKTILGSLLNYEYDLRVYLNSLTTPLPKIEKDKLNDLIYKPIKQGLNIELLSNAFDVAYLLAGYTAEAGLKNLVKRAHDATAVNSPTFTQYEGFKSNGTSSYIKLNYNANTDKDSFDLNSASFGLYLRSEEIGSYCDLGCNASGNRIYFLRNRGLTEYVCLNSSIISVPQRNTITGMNIVSRIDSAKITEYHNGVKLYDITSPSSIIPNKELYVSALNDLNGANLFSPRQISFCFVGKGLSISDVQVITDVFETYMDSNGKGVIA